MESTFPRHVPGNASYDCDDCDHPGDRHARRRRARPRVGLPEPPAPV